MENLKALTNAQLDELYIQKIGYAGYTDAFEFYQDEQKARAEVIKILSSPEFN